MSGVRMEARGRLAVLRLDKARGNAIDDALAAELLAVTGEIARDDRVAGVLLASAHPKLFCPGLDLVALAGHDRPAMEGFMRTFAAAVWGLYGLPKPVVAAVGGAAVAGGCILALTADHRVLKAGAPIGLNEVRVGVPLPWSVTVLLRASVSPPALGRIALVGSNFTDEEAVRAGLAHEIAGAEGFEETCLARLAELADRDASALAATKAWLRGPALAEMMAHEGERVGTFLDGWFSPGTQERLRATVDALAKKG